MSGTLLIYLGSVLLLIWGVAHLFPTKSVVKGFGNINQDNKNIIAMEWIVEGVAIIFVGVLIIVVTILDPENIISVATYITTAIFLIIMAVVSLFTGFKINFIPFRLCPVIFTLSAILITAGWITIN